VLATRKKDRAAVVYPTEADSPEPITIGADNTWVIAHCFRVVAEYSQSLREHSNPPGLTLTGIRFGR